MPWGRSRHPSLGRTISQSIINEARCYLCIYVLLAVLSAMFQTSVLVTFWLVPAILGQPILRLYLLAEHTLCPLIPDMLRNSRTTLTLLPVRFIAWNMPYHAEHHALMAITVSCVAQGSCFVSRSDRPLDPRLQYISWAIAGRDSARKPVNHSKEADLVSGRSC